MSKTTPRPQDNADELGPWGLLKGPVWPIAVTVTTAGSLSVLALSLIAKDLKAGAPDFAFFVLAVGPWLLVPLLPHLRRISAVGLEFEFAKREREAAEQAATLARKYFVTIAVAAALPDSMDTKAFRQETRALAELARSGRTLTFEEFNSLYETLGSVRTDVAHLYTSVAELTHLGIIEVGGDRQHPVFIRVAHEFREALVAAFGGLPTD